MRKAVVLLLLVFSCSVLFAGDRGPSTQDERDRLVRVTKALEVDPLSSQLRAEREWAMLFLMEVPDISVKLCSKSVGFLLNKKYKYSSEFVALATLEGGRYAVEHPDNTDSNAQALAMVEGVLKGYEALLNRNPKAKSKDIDEMLQRRESGQLPAYMANACTEGK